MWNCICLGRQVVREDEVISPKTEPAIIELQISTDEKIVTVDTVEVLAAPKTPEEQETRTHTGIKHGPPGEYSNLRTPAKELAARINDEDDTATSWLTPIAEPSRFKEIIDSTSAELQSFHSPQLRVVVDTTSAMNHQDTGTVMSLNQRFKQASMGRKFEQHNEQHITNDDTETPMKLQCHTPIPSLTDSPGLLQDSHLVNLRDHSIMPRSSSQQLEAQRLMQALADVSMDMGGSISSRFTPMNSTRSMYCSSPLNTSRSCIPRKAADISEIPSTPRRLQAARQERSRPSTARVSHYSGRNMYQMTSLSLSSSRLPARGSSTARCQYFSTPRSARGATCSYPASFTMIPHAPQGCNHIRSSVPCAVIDETAPTKIPSFAPAAC